MEIVIGRYLEDKLLHSKLETSFGKEQAQQLIGPLLHLEELFYGAHLFGLKVLEIEQTIESKKKSINDYFCRLDNPGYLTLLAYEYAFFSCCGRIYRELNLLNEHIGSQAGEIEDITKKIEALKDLRDGFEHGVEDYYEELRKKWENLNWKNRLRKGALSKTTGKITYYVDFENNLKLVKDAYMSFISYVFGNDTKAEVKL